MQVTLLVVLSSIVIPSAAVAQSRFEVGAGLSTLVAPGGSSSVFADSRVNIARETAVEATGDFTPYGSGVQGFYLLQGRQTFGPSSARVTQFATAGFLGEFSYRR